MIISKRQIVAYFIGTLCHALCAHAQSYTQAYNTYLILVATCDSARTDTDPEAMYRHAHKTVLLTNMLNPESFVVNSVSADSLTFYRSEGNYYMGRYFLETGVSSDNIHYIQLASNYFKSAISQRKSMASPSDLSDLYNQLAFSYYQSNQIDSAVIIYRNNINLCKENGNMRSLATAHHNLGCHYLKYNFISQAETNLQNALRIRQMIGDREHIAATYIELGKVYIALQDYERANSHVQRALQISASKQAYSILISALHSSYVIARERKDNVQALRFLERELAMRDSLYLMQNQSSSTDIENQYRILLNECKLEALEKQNKIESLLLANSDSGQSFLRPAIILLHIFFVLAVGFAIYFLIQYRKNKRYTAELKNQNRVIQKQSNELSVQRDKLSEIYESSNDSIRYASKIQLKVMNGAHDIKDVFPLSFVFYKPKELVSGDFYYTKEIGEYRVAAVADCTGHGMPAALLSILCFSFLNEELSSPQIHHANEILEALRTRIKETLNTQDSNDTVLDGCDMGIVIYHKESNKLEFSGANMDLYMAKQRRNDDPSAERDIELLRGTRNPLGWFLKEQPFKCYTTELNNGDSIYMLTDGFKDQLGKEGTFGAIRVKKLLSRIANLTINEQRREVQSTFSAWMDTFQQMDDVTILGIKMQTLKKS